VIIKVYLSKDIPKWIMGRYYPKFKATGERQGWWNIADSVVAGISGGPDSVALLWMLVNLWRGKVIVAHFEHGIRGRESIEDAVFVRDLAFNFQCPFFMESVPVPQLRQKGEGIEEAARRLRYEFLEKIRSENKAAYIAVGHHNDDLVETVIFNVIRGTGLRGLQGIPEKRGYIVRPLIDFTRREITDLLEGLSINWREDSTNVDVNYARNKIRLQLIPLLEREYNPKIRKHIAFLSRQAFETANLLENEAAKINGLVGIKPLPYTKALWDRKALRSLNLPALQITECLRRQQRDLHLTTLSSDRTELLLKLIKDKINWRFQWEGKVEVCGDKNFIAWLDWDVNDRLIDVSIDLESRPNGTFPWNGWEISWELLEGKFTQSKFGTHQCRLIIDNQESAVIRVMSAIKARKTFGWNLEFMSWWAKRGWPIFILSCKMWWVPIYGEGKGKNVIWPSSRAVQIKVHYQKDERM